MSLTTANIKDYATELIADMNSGKPKRVTYTSQSVYIGKLKEVIEHYGKDAQIEKTIEELNELKEALYDGSPVSHIAEEIADVQIMIDQLKVIFNISDDQIRDIQNYKITRTMLRMREEGSK